MKLKLTIIGCGRLGKTLAFLWKKANLVSIQDIYNSSILSAEKAVAFIGEGVACHTITQFKPADIYLIATPDDRIEIVCQQLAKETVLKAGSLVFHCSGLLTSDSLNAVKSLNCYTASIHPVFSFSDPASNVVHFSGTYCSCEGDAEALARLSILIEGIEGRLFLIKKEHKALYHIASVFASNYLVTLSVLAEECYKKAGLSDSLTKKLVCTLMQQTLNRVKDVDIGKNALTGPLQRGDRNTLLKHLEILQPYTHLKYAYKNLGKTTLLLTEHVVELKKALEALF